MINTGVEFDSLFRFHFLVLFRFVSLNLNILYTVYPGKITVKLPGFKI